MDTTRDYETLEVEANQFFTDTLDAIKYSYVLHKKSDMPGSKDLAESYEKMYKQLQEFREMFMSLKERYKHRNDELCQEIFRDWYDYSLALQEIRRANNVHDISKLDFTDTLFEDTIREPNIIRSVIEKRFKKLLSENHD